MDDERMGAVVADALRARAEGAPGASELLQAVVTGARRRAAVRRRVAVAGVAAVVAAVAGTVVPGVEPGWVGRPSDGARVAAAPGMRQVSSHGLRLDVPVGWELNPKNVCGPHGRDRVIDDDALSQVLCEAPADAATLPGQEVIFSSLVGKLPTEASPTVHLISIDGVRGVLFTDTDESVATAGMTERQLALPDLHVIVLIETRSPALADAIVASAHVIAR